MNIDELLADLKSAASDDNPFADWPDLRKREQLMKALSARDVFAAIAEANSDDDGRMPAWIANSIKWLGPEYPYILAD